MKSRKISQIIEPQMVIEGAGVLLRRSIAPRKSNEYDPFLLFDHFAFNDPAEVPVRGFPTHPHRGIETVTYMLEGSVRHRDSLGNEGIIGPGDIQWMTAGGGVLHEEMPQRSPQGVIYGFQLWVNLPADRKWIRPRYRGVSADEIPTVQNGDVKIRIIAGTVDGVREPVAEIAAQPVYLDVEIAPGAAFEYGIPESHTAIAYVFEGEGLFGGERMPVSAVRMTEFGRGERIEVRAAASSAVRFVLIAGAPFQEPIFPYGPFVMNTMDEIMEAMHDLRDGTFIWDERDPRFRD